MKLLARCGRFCGLGALIVTAGNGGLSADVAGLSHGEAADAGYALFHVLPDDFSGRVSVP